MKRIFTLLMGMVIVCGLLLSVVPNVNAVTYQWSTLDYPGAFWTTAYGIDSGNIVGSYWDASVLNPTASDRVIPN